jgi:hypothetical protein
MLMSFLKCAANPQSRIVSGDDEYKTAARTVNGRPENLPAIFVFPTVTVMLSEAKHLGFASSASDS